MTISELIVQLETIKASNGDLPVLLADWNEDCFPPAVCECAKVESDPLPTSVVLDTERRS